jgi:GMP synthase (glutamine-hydrolysing)
VRVLSISHQADAGPGVFADELEARAVAHDEWLISGGGEPPGDPAGYDAVMVFGGAMNTDQEDVHPWLREEKLMLADLLHRGTPLLGVCLGSQLLAEAAGAAARRASEPEIGWLDVELTAEGVGDPLLSPLAPGFTAFQWHSYESPLPPGAVALARSPVCLQAYRVGTSAWGIQFHAEVSERDAIKWAIEYDVDPDAVRIGIDPDELTASVRERIAGWNAVGRAICGRFLDLAGR